MNCVLLEEMSIKNKHLFFRPFYSRTPQVWCKVPGDQSCSQYFIGTFQLRGSCIWDDAAVPVSWKNWIHPSQMLQKTQWSCFTGRLYLCSCCSFDTKRGISPPEAVVVVVGSGLLRSSHETACEETMEVVGSRKKVCVFSSLQRQVLFGCVRGLRGLVWPTGTLKNFCDEFWEKRTLHCENWYFGWSTSFQVPKTSIFPSKDVEIFRHWKLATFNVLKASYQ